MRHKFCRGSKIYKSSVWNYTKDEVEHKKKVQLFINMIIKRYARYKDNLRS